MNNDRLKELAGINEGFMGQPDKGYPSASYTNPTSMLRSFMNQVSEFAKYELEDELRDDLLRLVDEFRQHANRQGNGGMG